MLMDMVYCSLVDRVLGVNGISNQFKKEVSQKENIPRCMSSMLAEEMIIDHLSSFAAINGISSIAALKPNIVDYAG